jgi:serine/threonine protein kinase
MGELDLAVTGDRGMEKLCVIKRVLPHLLAADNVQRFREEAMVVVRLSHGNLVGVLDAGREEGQFYLAMDFVEGKDLLATWNQCAARRVAFPVEIAAYVIKELARGLAYAHAYRDLHLVHRDISPANVLLSYSGEVKLTDFGLATSKLKEQRTAPGIIYGKLSYLAPEQARGQPLDGRTDLYAAGILLWEMLTGQQLFPTKPKPADPPLSGVGGNSTLEALERLKNPVVVPPSSLSGRVPPMLDAIVMRALGVEPEDRYQTGEDLRADLASFLAKHAPETDAATLASFMSVLWDEHISNERSDRDALMQEASTLLRGDGRRGGSLAGDVPRGAEGVLMDSPRPSGLSRRFGNAAPASAQASIGSDAQAASLAFRHEETSGGGASGAHRPSSGAGGAVGDRAGGAPSGASGDEIGGVFSVPASGRDSAPGSVAPSNGDVRERIPPRAGVHLGDTMTGSTDGAAGDIAAAKDGSAQSASANSGNDEDQRIGTTIGGRYFLRRLCGEGAMGRVYEGHHVEIGRRVAIKVLHSNFRNTPDVVERFRREARAASKIGHPNIVDVTDSGTTPDGAFFFVMEYLDGVDLEQLIAREGPFPIERALLIAAQVCRALVAAHTAGIVHRDLKPANVMLVRHRDEDDFVKVLDFGISKQSELDIDPRGKHVGLTRPDAAVGTPIYMAPEQVAGLPTDGRTDVYAVGELLFEMFTGVAPCGGSDVIAVFNKKANEDPAPVRTLRPEVPVAIERMLVQAMSRRPADRHPTMAALKDQIMGCVATHGRAGDLRGDSLRADMAPPPSMRPSQVADIGGTTKARPPWGSASLAIWITGAGLVVGVGLAAVVVLWQIDVSGPRYSSVPRAGSTGSQASAPRATTPATHASPLTPAAPPPLVGPASSSRTMDTAVAAPAGSGPGPMAAAPPVTPDKARNQQDDGARSRSRAAAPSGRAGGTGLAPHARSRPDRQVAVANSPSPAAPITATTTATSPATSPGSPPPRPSSGSSGRAAPRLNDALLRGRSAFAKGNFPAAVRFGRAALASGDAVDGHLLVADAFYKMERYADALAEYDLVLKLAPASPHARRGRELALRHVPP